jgi:hypothetical protein
MSNLFNITEEEKNRILNLHETATKNLYLIEQIVTNYDSKYDYKKENDNYFFRLKNTDNWRVASGKGLESIKTKVFKTPITPTSKNKQKTNQNSSPFESQEWGNHFRLWVNQNLPSVANKFKLSKKGPHNNKNIINTWNYDLPLKGGKTMKLGEYYKLKNPELELKSKIESNYFPVPTKIEGSDRINKELLYISKRKEYSGKPFFIIDPLHNLVLVFNEKHELVDYSQSVAGADKQPDEVFTYEDWCVASNLKYDKFKKRCVGEEVASAVDSDNAQGKSPNYKILEKISKRGQKEGIYKVRGTRYEPGYQGDKGVDNLFYLQTKDGVAVPTAIHSLVNIPNRVIADKELSEFLQKEKKFGKIPNEYIHAVETLTSKYDLSSGCFNVDPKFVNNPEVIRIAKNKAFVFIMSERKENYLVQITPNNQDDFFINLKGDGKNCKSIESIGTQLGGEGINTAVV